MVALAAAGISAVLVGLPTAIIPSGHFVRMTAVLWWNYPVWILGSVLSGLAVAARPAYPGTVTGGTGITGGVVLTALAVGCPSCNSLVVATLGASGAVALWAPLQPLVAVMALALLTRSLLRRLRAQQSSLMPAVGAVCSPVRPSPSAPNLEVRHLGLLSGGDAGAH